MTKEQISKKEAEERVASERIRQRILDRFEITMRIEAQQERQKIRNKIDELIRRYS